MRVVILLVTIFGLMLSCYNLGRANERRFTAVNYHSGMTAGIKLGCVARGKSL